MIPSQVIRHNGVKCFQKYIFTFFPQDNYFMYVNMTVVQLFRKFFLNTARGAYNLKLCFNRTDVTPKCMCWHSGRFFLISIETHASFFCPNSSLGAKKKSWIKWFVFLVNLHSYGTTIIKRAVHFLPYHLFSQNLAERLVLICYNDISILLIALRCYQV